MKTQRDCIGMSKWELDTPCLAVDEGRLKQNIQAMQAHMAAFGKQLRPHTKTHKCSHIAGMQMDAGCIGICVAKISEAEVLVKNGLHGVLVTSPVVTDHKIERLMECLSIDPQLMVVIDNPSNAEKLNETAKKHKLDLNVLVDIDPGPGRTGVPLKDGLAIAKMIQTLPSLRLRGVQSYAGFIQHIPSFEERYKTSLDCMGRVAEVVRQLREADLPCDIFTGSGTGTYEIDCRIPELTDLQTGSYTMMDAEYLSIGSSQNPSRFEKFPPSLTLLTTVISANHDDFVTVDAGLKAIYHHGATPYVLHPSGSTYDYDWWGDEHGKVAFKHPSRRPELGEVLEMVVSHCDPTVNLFDVLYFTSNERVTGIWPIDMRGKCQ
jgi:D-serine deaminase-like pyridoxal phosphate-dependent protein